MAIQSLAELKKSRQQQIDKLNNLVKKQETSGAQGSGGKDERIWTPHYDKDKKTGFAVVRFLPQAPGEDYPWVKVYRHAFKGPTGKWYIENSLSTIGGTDPVGSLNSRLWNSGVESDKEVARTQKRNVNYYQNVLVLEDPANPENVGKVKLYRFGTKIFEMIKGALAPEFEDESPMDPFDPWGGADFVIKIREVAGYPNYDKSYFKEPKAMGEDDYIDKVWKQAYPLSEFLDVEKNFKSYEELQKRLLEVLGPEVGSGLAVIEGEAPGARQATARQAPTESARQAPARQTAQAEEKEDDDLPWGSEDATADETTADDMDDFLNSL